MPAICLYFQAHQPERLLPAELQTPGRHFDSPGNAAILNHVADHCYLPTNELLGNLIAKSSGRFRFALSLSGTLIDQLLRFRPDVLESFQQLVSLGGVELLAETYHHSIAFIHSNREFDRQVDLHLDLIEDLFEVRPRVFRNTELIYNDAIAAKAETMGFDGVIAECPAQDLSLTQPTFLYRAPETARIKTLLRHSQLSNDLGFNFANPTWPHHPLSPATFCSWIADTPGDVVNLFLGYESIGEHQPASSGIFEFWKSLPNAASDAGLQWVTPSEAVDLYRASLPFPCRFLTSWTDGERDLSAWIGNSLQREALDRIHALEKPVHAANHPELLHLWAQTQTSNHFHWMSTKGNPSQFSHSPLTPYRSPTDAFDRLSCLLDTIESAVAPPPGSTT